MMRPIWTTLWIGGLLAAPVLAGSAPAARAADFLSTTFASTESCFARRYDTAHLARHPAQRVASIFLVPTGHSDSNYATILHLGFRLKGSPALYDGFAYCNSKGAGAECLLEGDSGSLTLAPRKDGLRLTVGDFLMVESAAGFSPDLAKGGDDRVFHLSAAPVGACR